MTYPPFAYMEPAIAQGESGGDWNALYNYQNRAGGLFGDVNVSDMTINEVLDFQRTGSPYATYVTDILGYKATPVGRYQIVGDTLDWAKGKLGLTGEEKFDPATQRQIAEYIYNTQGPSAWEALKGTHMADQVTPQQMAPQQAAGYQQFGPENLSRSQRTMLGFAALRDAAAALRGNQTSFFSDAYGGLEQQHRYGQELAFRQGQEQRLIDERAAAASQSAVASQLRAAEALAQVRQQLQWSPNDPTLLALEQSLMAQALGPSGMMPATAAPAVTPTTAPATAPAMTLPSATTAANDPSKLSDEELASAMSVLATSNDPKAIAALEIMRDEAATRAEGAQTAEAAARRKAEVASMIQREGGVALGFLVQKDEGGNPIFENGAPKLNSQLATRPSRALAAMGQSQEYQDFAGALQTIKSTLTIDNLSRLSAQKVTLGQITESEWPRIEALSGALDPNNPAGTLRTLLRLQEDYDLDFGLTPPAASGTDDLSDEELQELYIPKG